VVCRVSGYFWGIQVQDGPALSNEDLNGKGIQMEGLVGTKAQLLNNCWVFFSLLAKEGNLQDGGGPGSLGGCTRGHSHLSL
jgi:hypothetical protein